MELQKIMLIVWVGLAVLFLIAEMITAGFALAWFGVGAAVAAVLALVKAPVWLQIVAFGVVSGVLFTLSRTIFKKLTKSSPQTGVGSERLLGRVGMVIERIDPSTDNGKVRVYKEEWRANSADGKPVEVGTPVEVISIEGVHLIVKPKEE